MKRPSGLVLCFGAVVALQLAWLGAMALIGQINIARDASPPAGVPLARAVTRGSYSDNLFSGPAVHLSYALPTRLTPPPAWAKGLARHAIVPLVVARGREAWVVEGPATGEAPWGDGRVTLRAELSLTPAETWTAESLEIDWQLSESLPRPYGGPSLDFNLGGDGYLWGILGRGALNRPYVRRVERVGEPFEHVLGLTWNDDGRISVLDVRTERSWDRAEGESPGEGPDAGFVDLLSADERLERSKPLRKPLSAAAPDGEGGWIALGAPKSFDGGDARSYEILGLGHDGAPREKTPGVVLDEDGVVGADELRGGLLVVRRGETTGRSLARIDGAGEIETLVALPAGSRVVAASVSPDGTRLLAALRNPDCVLASDPASKHVDIVTTYGLPVGVRFTRFGDAWIVDAGAGRAILATAAAQPRVTVEGLSGPVVIGSDPVDGALWLAVRSYRGRDGKAHCGIVRVSRDGQVGEEVAAETFDSPKSQTPEGAMTFTRRSDGRQVLVLFRDRPWLEASGALWSVAARGDRRAFVMGSVILLRDGTDGFRVLDGFRYPEPRTLWQR